MKTTCSFAIFLLIPAVWADTNGVGDPADSKDNSELSFIDEVIVVEQKNVSQLRTELKKADDQLFSLYNTLNTDDSLDMICKKQTRIGSQIKYRVCKSSYHRQLEGESGSEFLEDGDASASAGPPAGHYAKVRENMSRLMTENPDLQKAFYKRAILRKKIAEQKENK
jgi:hypothetical protein